MNGQTRRSAAHSAKQVAAAREARIARAKAERKAWWDNEVEHFLYRCYAADGTLLYIGCTSEVTSRMAVHASSWQNPASAYLNVHMDRYEVEGPFKGRIAGRKAEREAIEREAPFLNLHHNKGRGAKRVPVGPMTEAQKAELNRAFEGMFGDVLGGRSA